VLRGLSTASFATFVSLLSHVAGGGAPPGALGVLVPWALSLMLCVRIAARKPSLPRLTASVALSQLLFHALFVVGAAPSASVPAASTPASGHAGHLGHALPSFPQLIDDPRALLHADATMWISHGVAAVLTILVLHRGEQALLALHALADELRARARRLLLPITGCARWLPVEHRAEPPTSTTWTVVESALRSATRQRGPPPIHAR